MKTRTLTLILLALLVLLACGPVATVARADTTPGDTTTPPPPCQAPEYHQLDFWVGSWDLTWKGGTGTNNITRELGGCVIEEHFTTTGDDHPFAGKSVSVYNPVRKKWQQTWVDNAGAYMAFEGGMVGDSMILGRSIVDTAGVTHWQRMIFFNITHDSFDWHWQKSTDGQTWTLAWAIHYKRRM